MIAGTEDDDNQANANSCIKQVFDVKIVSYLTDYHLARNNMQNEEMETECWKQCGLHQSVIVPTPRYKCHDGKDLTIPM